MDKIDNKMSLRFVVTTGCNANCYFCLNEYIGSKSKVTSMLPQDYKMISECANRIGIRSCTISGGEPTLRADLKKIVKAISSSGLKITIVSNGYLLKNHLKSYGAIDELHVSYHSLNKIEWERITKVKNGPQTVRDNLRIVRQNHPNLSIRLNVVSDEKNSKKASIEKYVQLAKEINAEISVFQNGYLRLLKEMGKLEQYEDSCDFWDLDSFGGKLIEITRRKRIYDVDGVKISLSYLSSEKCSGTAIWITPKAEGFADIRKRSPLINFQPLLRSGDMQRIEDSLSSLTNEATMLKDLEIKGISINCSPKYNKLINQRKSNLITMSNPYSF
jgi:wyosine [tRNA(Phe)-imidazoG37] synthetase (radical SAM superfamily)